MSSDVARKFRRDRRLTLLAGLAIVLTLAACSPSGEVSGIHRSQL